MRYCITGGIGSGKSFVCRRLEQAGYPVFNCDLEARLIVCTDPTVREALKALVGQQLYDTSGSLRKTVLADYIRCNPANAARVNAIVHPRVRDIYKEWVNQRERNMPTDSPGSTFMECALLFEAHFEDLVDKVIAVYAPEEVRIRRVMMRDGVSPEQVKAWMRLQMDEEEKRRRAVIIIRNDSTTPLDLSPLLALIRK
ncbi:MAG: dephospho-CoA kinase [Alloprevotella sp.]|nr:dephospho-CoA kinase [Alloprevotella sp.]